MDKEILKRIWRQLSRRRKVQLSGLLILMLCTSFAELFSLGAVVPFLSALVAPDKIFNHPQLKPIIDVLGLETPQDLLLPLTILFSVGVVAASAVRIFMNYVQLRLSLVVGVDFGSRLFEKTLYQPYIVHVSRHSSEILSGVSKASNLISYAVSPLLTLASSGLLVLFMFIMLTYINPLVSIASLVGFCAIYFTFFRYSRHRLSRNSVSIARNADAYNKILQEGMGGIRDIIMDGTQKVYSKHFKQSFSSYQISTVSNNIIGTLPKFGVEALGMVMIALLAFWMSATSSGVIGAIPVLGALALGAQRMLPLINNVYVAFVTLKGGRQNVIDALELMEQPMPDLEPVQPIPFKEAITFQNVGFRYSENTPWVLQHLDLTISKGSRVGMMGITGSGKSTFLDITMGLLQPTEGALMIDGLALDSYPLQRNWQSHIAHVPQSIFLSATTIAENIAFGIQKDMIDMKKVERCAAMAQLTETIEKWPKRYETQVGERGIRLSGGQRQRIGIARALYKDVDVLILDEATSALDHKTESAVMDAINSLNPDLTIIMVAHRLSTLENCDVILEVEGGKARQTHLIKAK